MFMLGKWRPAVTKATLLKMFGIWLMVSETHPESWPSNIRALHVICHAYHQLQDMARDASTSEGQLWIRISTSMSLTRDFF